MTTGTADNARHARLAFAVRDAATLHGFSGYFEAHLYGRVQLSTVPGRASPNMFSWFPMYFPIQTPLPVAAGASVTATVWRCIDARRMWYEWAAEVRGAGGASVLSTHIHNAGGRSYYVAQ